MTEELKSWECCCGASVESPADGTVVCMECFRSMVLKEGTDALIELMNYQQDCRGPMLPTPYTEGRRL